MAEEKLFGDGPWKKVPFPEPVHVEAGKNYEVGIGTDGVPYCREIERGGIAFSQAGTLWSVGLYRNPGTVHLGHGMET